MKVLTSTCFSSRKGGALHPTFRTAARFYRVVMPLARPWIAGGATLVLMEALADFGAVSIFNFDTFTTVIYKAWFGSFSLAAAAQLATLLVVLVFGLILLEQRLRETCCWRTANRSRPCCRATAFINPVRK